jgi:taurine dioxygenase
MTVTTESIVDVRPIAGALGAEIHGVDLEHLSDAVFQQLHAALMAHLVLFFPDAADLTPEAHKAFGRRLGELEVHPFLPTLPGHDEIVVLDSDQGAKADVWHTDVTFAPSPPIASILRLVQCPPYGGDTMWSNQYLAYQALSAPLQELLTGLTARHVFEVPGGSYRSEAEHPVVRTHPVTGRRSLYVNRMFTTRIVQLSKDESDLLLPLLFEISERPAHICRFRWQPGAVALWDNRATQHHAINDYTEQRVGQRVTILGDEPHGEAPRWAPHVDNASAAAASKA